MPPKTRKSQRQRGLERTARRPAVLLSAVELARVLGVSRPTINQFVLDGMPNWDENRKFNAGLCVQWRITQIEQRALNGPKARGAAPIARQGLLESQKTRIDLEVAKLREEVVPRELFERILNSIGSMLSSRLDGLGPRLAGELAGSDDPAFIQQRLFDEHRSIRSVLAADVEKFSKRLLSEAEASDSDSAAAA